MKYIERSPIDRKISEDTGIPLPELDGRRLEEYQLGQIRRMLSYLSRSRFYREKLKDVVPEKIRTFADFRRLPLTSEADLAGHEKDFLCISPDTVKRMVTVPTTGTTGGRKRIAFSERDLRRAGDFILTAYTTFVKPGDRMMVMMSGGTPGSIGDVVTDTMKRLDVSTFVYGQVTDLEEAYRAVRSFAPDVITGIPVQMAALSRYAQLKGGLRVREVLLSADDVPDAVCMRLQRSFGAETFRHYGMTELCIAGGCECRADAGYHIRSSDHYFEILDPDPAGFGEIAVTTFCHEAMPLLRYRTGDFGRIDRSPCGCKSLLPRLCDVRGRLRNSRTFPGGRLFLRDIEEVLFRENAVADFTCAAAEDSLDIRLFHLPGDMPELGRIRNGLAKLPALSGVRTALSCSEMQGFRKACQAKKTLELMQ